MGSANIETIETAIGVLEFELGMPTAKTVACLFDQIDFQRACQAYLWALPVVGFAQFRVLHRESAGAGPGDVVTYEGHAQPRGVSHAEPDDALHHFLRRPR